MKIIVLMASAMMLLAGCGKQPCYHPKHLEPITPKIAHFSATKDDVTVHARALSRTEQAYYFEQTKHQALSIKVVQVTVANQRESAITVHRSDIGLTLCSEGRLMKRLGFAYVPHVLKAGLGCVLLVPVVMWTMVFIPARYYGVCETTSLILGGFVAGYTGVVSLLGMGFGGYSAALQANAILRSDLREKMLPLKVTIPSHETVSYLLFCNGAYYRPIFSLAVRDAQQHDQATFFTIDMMQHGDIPCA